MYFVRVSVIVDLVFRYFCTGKDRIFGKSDFYDAMLTDVTDPERMDAVSSHGYAWGYIGSCIPFVACLGVVLGAKPLGIGMQTAMIIAFIITALWWLLSSVPLLRSYRQKYFAEVNGHVVKDSFKRLGKLLRSWLRKSIFLYFYLRFSFILTVCIPLLIWRQRTDRLLDWTARDFCSPFL